MYGLMVYVLWLCAYSKLYLLYCSFAISCTGAIRLHRRVLHFAIACVKPQFSVCCITNFMYLHDREHEVSIPRCVNTDRSHLRVCQLQTDVDKPCCFPDVIKWHFLLYYYCYMEIVEQNIHMTVRIWSNCRLARALLFSFCAFWYASLYPCHGRLILRPERMFNMHV
jgi:hypothetical protein